MSLSARVAALASRIGAEFKATEIDLASYLASGFTGTLVLRKRGSTLAMIAGSVSRSSGAAIGPSTSITQIAQLPLDLAPVSTVTTDGRTSASGSGFGSGSMHLSSSGALTIAGQRSGDTAVLFGIAYLPA